MKLIIAMTKNDSPGYKIRDQFATHFITVTIVGWIDLFTRKQCRDIIIDSLKYCQQNKGLIVNAYVIMDSHLHMVLTAKENSNGLSPIIRDFKKFTAFKLNQWVMNNNKESRSEWMKPIFNLHGRKCANNRNFKVWKEHNRPMVLKYPRFIAQKVNYIHNNPVKAGIVRSPQDYIYSSASNYANRKDVLIEAVKIM